MQQLGPVVLERVNSHLGWRAVGKLVLKQGPVAAPAVSKPAPPPDPAVLARIDAQVASVENAELREALARLGRGIAQRRKAAADDTAS